MLEFFKEEEKSDFFICRSQKKLPIIGLVFFGKQKTVFERDAGRGQKTV